MGNKAYISLLIGLLTAVTLAFNHCSNVIQRGGEAEEPSVPKGNGDFYTGKTYVVINPGQCADGSEVVARLRFISDQEARMSRENCANLPTPRPIPAASIVKPADTSTVIVEGTTFTYETASLLLNGGFEQGLAEFQLTGGTIQLTADAFSGSSAVTLGQPSNWSWIQQGIDPSLLVPGRRYTLRAAGKVNGANPLKIAFKIDGDSPDPDVDLDLAVLTFTSTTYEVQEASFVWPAGQTWSVLYAEHINNNGPSTATFDDISVFESP